jgi:signal recognition particle GTPase
LAEDEVLEQDFAAEAADYVLGTDSYPDEADSARPLALGQKRSWWTRLRDGLSPSSGSIGEGLAAIFAKRKLDAGMLEELEDVLIRADLGVATDLEGNRRPL